MEISLIFEVWFIYDERSYSACAEDAINSRPVKRGGIRNEGEQKVIKPSSV